VGLKDSANKIVNAVGQHTSLDSYMDQLVDYQLSPGDSWTDTIDLNHYAHQILWQDSSGMCGPIGFSGIDSSFNLRIVTGAYFAITNASTAGSNDAYKSYKLDRATLELSNILVGAKNLVLDLPNSAQSNSTNFHFYPNPAKETLHFSQELDNITLSDLSGNAAVQTGKATQLNVQGLPKGMYLLRASSLSHPVKVLVE
jgi:hypothetical protein